MTNSSKLLYGIIAALIVVIMFLRCGKSCNTPVVHSDTTYAHKSDTVVVYTPGPTVTVPVYVPTPGITTPGKIPIPSSDIAELIKQYQDVAGKFYATTQYKDSVVLKDSSGKDVGHVRLNDNISQNTLKSRAVDYQLNFPTKTITNTNTVTITNTVLEQRRQLYLGLGIDGNQQSYINGGHASLLYKTAKDHMYELRGGVQQPFGQTSLKPQFSISTFFKIKL